MFGIYGASEDAAFSFASARAFMARRARRGQRQPRKTLSEGSFRPEHRR